MLINNLENINLHKSAIWVKNGIKDLYIDKTDLERFSVGSFKKDCWNESVPTQKIEVKTEILDKYIDKPVDLLKLDVEGSEQTILNSIKEYFKNIKHIILEYHPTKDQSINKILNMLSKSYDIQIYDDGKLLKRGFPRDRLLTIKAIYKH